MDGCGGTYFYCLPALCLFLRSAGLLEDVSGEVFTHLEILWCDLNTTVVVNAGINVNVIPARRVQWVSADFITHLDSRFDSIQPLELP